VVEPAAAGLPVLFGPVHDRWEASEMVRRAVAMEVPPEDVLTVLAALLGDSRRRADMGKAARQYVESGRGATEASVRLVLDLLDRKPVIC
jgi:3-deoxy-D-manno-octulosonic-acid transferase